jgi:hypothetical protein
MSIKQARSVFMKKERRKRRKKNGIEERSVLIKQNQN